MNRRRLLASITSAGAIGFAGCFGDDDDGGSGNGNGDTGSNGDGGGYDPDDYYGLPECDGSRPIQLISVSGSTGIIRNVTSDDLLVLVEYVYEEGEEWGFSEGDYCDAYRLDGGEQSGYATSGHDEPPKIRIATERDTQSNRDTLCNAISGGLGEYNDGCVDPDTFQG